MSNTIETTLYAVALDVEGISDNAEFSSDYSEAEDDARFQDELAEENGDPTGYKVFEVQVTIHLDTAKESK